VEDRTTGIHYDDEDFISYFRRKLPPSEAVALEMHLAECDACSESARNQYLTFESSRLATPEEHLKAYEEYVETIRDSVEVGLRAAATLVTAAVRDRFLRWVRSAKGWRVSGPLPGGGSLWASGYFAVPEAVLGANNTLTFAADTVAEHISLESGKLVVRFRDIPAQGHPPLVFQIPVRSPESPSQCELSWNDAESQWSGDFDAPEDDYVLAIVPNP